MSSDGAKLVWAAQKGGDAKVKRLLKAKVDVNSTITHDGVSGVTALQTACSNGHIGAARLLLKAHLERRAGARRRQWLELVFRERPPRLRL